MTKRLIALLGVAFAIWVAIGIYRAGDGPQIPPPGIGSAIALGNGMIYGRRIAMPAWQASYDRISTNADNTILALDGVHDGIVDRDGKPYLRITAKHMTVNVPTHDFTGSGGIEIRLLAHDSPVRRVQAEQIVWSNAIQRLAVVGRVRIDSGAAEPLVVDGLLFDVPKGSLHIGAISGAANLR